MATHLVQKPGESTWYVRMAVPADVRHAFGGRAKLIKTTGTSNRSEAMDRRLPILAQWKADIAAAREHKLVSGDQWRLAQHQAGLDLQTQRTKAITRIYTPVSPDEPTPSFAWFEQLPEIISNLRNEGHDAIASRLTDYAKRYVAALEDGITAGAGIDLHNELLTIMADMEAVCISEEYGLSDAEHQEAKAIIHNPVIYKPVSPITDGRLDKFRAQRVKDSIANKTIDQQESKLRKLSDYLRDQGKPLTSETVAAWLESLNMTSKTKAQYLLAGSTFWQWAIKHDTHWKELHQGQDNPFKEQALPKLSGKAKVAAARKAFTPEQIESLYKVAKTQNNRALCDLIELGSHTGCRIEELAQLRKESVVKVEGVLSFKIEDSKTAAGIREIPVHPSIQTTVERLINDSADGFLLPATSGNKYGIRSDSLSKAFGRMKTAEGFGKQHVFHSVRSMVITLLLRAGVVGPTVANIVGHETGIVTFDIYDEGASPQQKLKALEKLSFNFT
ncbi:tyrosine-type recombinase/integrase [Pseudomonas sp. PSKL.D1]|uniref:tyrosine-type recombinase/integrase n=1 Tax=Pseudomonas sp. PSKL.D1 TaxID=3029060 RepID=UPI00238120C6|nr:tyrosine-type recombinase/integrase [Pseudomonas sp. PSKL.D1]WDY56815.1 tyrosine-type recombinase/integrase [Pseudomonas sp. PSKL.D1]